MTSQEIIKQLKNGNKRFISGKTTSRTYKKIEQTPPPLATVLSCSDHRVVPEFIFDTNIGELFIIRLPGNIASSENITSIEFSHTGLGSNVIIVLGHEACAAVAAATGVNTETDLSSILCHIKPGLAQMPKDTSLNEAIKHSAKYQTAMVRNKSEVVRQAEAESRLAIVTAYYSLSSGEVTFLND